jgi:hypothetical protein
MPLTDLPLAQLPNARVQLPVTIQKIITSQNGPGTISRKISLDQQPKNSTHA